MAKVVFKFFEVYVKEDDVIPFIKNMDKLLKKFAGEAYHFRYHLEDPLDMTQSKKQKNESKAHHAGRHP